jgi:hypothetical protein
MGLDKSDTVRISLYENPNGGEPGEPVLYGLSLSQCGLEGLELLPKDQWRKVVAEFARLVELLP